MFTVDFRFEENQTTIEFPCNEEYLSSKFDELGVKDKLKTSQYVIGTNYAALKWLVTDFADVDELNFLAKCLDSFDKNELNIFEAVCETREPRSVAEMINITYNIYNYTLVQDMSSMEIIGKTHFKAVHIGWNPGEMENADLAKIGRELMNSGKGKVTEKGMLFEHEGARFINEYDGHNFPEYLYDQCRIFSELEKEDSTIIARIDKGEEIPEKVKEIALKENIKLASISALGAVNDFTVGVFKTDEKKYYSNSFQGNFEITSLTGTINTMNGEFYTHIHMSAGNEKGEVFGGHLNRAVVSATCEMVITIIDGSVDRYFDEDIGLNLFKFNEK